MSSKQHIALVSGPRPYTALSALASWRSSGVAGWRERGRKGGLKHGGLLEELLALFFCVKPVGGGTS